MHSRLHLATLGGLLLLVLQTPRAETRSSAMQIRVTVVRSCSVDTRGGSQGTVSLTCGRGATPGVMASSSGVAARIVPVPARQTTVVSLRPELPGRGTGETATRSQAVTRQVVTVNF